MTPSVDGDLQRNVPIIGDKQVDPSRSSEGLAMFNQAIIIFEHLAAIREGRHVTPRKRLKTSGLGNPPHGQWEE
jgi:hypothetical protein